MSRIQGTMQTRSRRGANLSSLIQNNNKRGSKQNQRKILTHVGVNQSSDDRNMEIPQEVESANSLLVVAPNNLPIVQPGPSNSINSSGETRSFESTVVHSYMSIKLAIDLVPKFDGKSCALSKFIKQSKLAYDRVHPNDKLNLLALIKNKIEGEADQLIANRGDPETLNDLISLLKNSFAKSFDVDRALDELNSLKQSDRESVEAYGARASEILSRGLEASKEKYNSQEIFGVNVMLNNAAVTGFIRGLVNSMHNAILSREKPTSLSKAIDDASALERETDKRNNFININPVNRNQMYNYPKINILTTDNSRVCYNCRKPGHVRKNCPRNHGFAKKHQLYCNYCRRTGHIEKTCWKKNRDNMKQNDELIKSNKNLNIVSSNSGNNIESLNSKLTSRESAPRSTRRVMRSQSTGLITNSK